MLTHIRRIILQGYCAQTRAFLNRTNGISATRARMYDKLIRGLIADGIWNSLDALYIYATADSATALLNLVQNNYNSTLVSTPTFTVDAGFTGDGAAQALNSNFNPTTATSPNYVQNSATIFIWSNTTAQASASATGNTDNFTSLLPRYTDDSVYYSLNEGGVGQGKANTDGKGFWSIDRNTSTNYNFYKNGALFDGPHTHASAAPVNATLRTLGTTSTFWAGQAMASGFGGTLGATKQANLYKRLRTYMTALGLP